MEIFHNDGLGCHTGYLSAKNWLGTDGAEAETKSLEVVGSLTISDTSIRPSAFVALFEVSGVAARNWFT